MEKHNREFLYRIEYILGERSKHPWGEALGLKNARIQSIFNGQIPTAPALEIIHRAENVRIDWLITGEGPHFVVESWRSDEDVAHTLTENLPLQEEKAAFYLLTDGSGKATVVTTVPTVHIYEDGVVSKYTEVRVFPYIGPKTMQVATEHPGLRIVTLDFLTLKAVSGGWKGPVHLLGGLLDEYTEAGGVGGAHSVREAVGRFEVRPEDEEQLLTHYRHLLKGERAAILKVIEVMDRTNIEK